MGFFEHSKKAGRIIALCSIIIIAGTLSIMVACKAPPNQVVTAIVDLIKSWLLVLGPMIGFYFGLKLSTD